MNRKWWHDKVVYELYPKSFLDTNGDGIGDLRGVISKLDYLKDLGIDIIWLCPIYKSPFVDQGYDVSDYYNIAEEYGTMEEFDELLVEAEKRGMKVIMDLVINHCSDQHEWFQKALAEPDGEYADYFYFVKGKDGKAPSNYRSYFGGSTWEHIPGTDKYYLHLFTKEQPDLNWENPKLKEHLFRMVNWWLDKGVAGFRVDAITCIKKDLAFPDFEPDGPDGLVSCVRMLEEVEGVGEMLKELKRETFQKYDAFTVGEALTMKEGEEGEYIGDDGHFSTIFDFSAHDLNLSERGWYDSKPFDFKAWRDTTYRSQLKIQKIGFEGNLIENHDEARGASHFLPVHARNEMGKKMLAVTSVLLRGIPFLYQGQEIGMENCKMDSIDEYDDVSTKDQYQVALDAGVSIEDALQLCYTFSRDNARTPMQWKNAANAGFTEGTPWLKVNPNYKQINVEEQEKREDSVLAFYKELLRLRKAEEYKETFVYGEFQPVFEDMDDIFAFYRIQGTQKILVAANFGMNKQTLEISAKTGKQTKLLLSNWRGRRGVEDLQNTGKILLESCEAVVILM